MGRKAAKKPPTRRIAATPTGISPLAIGIGVSLALHAAVLSLHFSFPDASRFMRDSALDIILVNARSTQKPVNAQARAQANLDGGGDTDEDRRAKTPLPPSLQKAPGDDLLELRKRQASELEAQQQQLIAQTRSARSASPGQSGEIRNDSQRLSGLDLAESAKAMVRLQGEIDKSVEDYNKRPRKKFVGARTEEYGLAPYITAWQTKVGRIGTLNYPPEAKGKLYGKLQVYVELMVEDGSVYTVEVRRSSGLKVLDTAAVRIIKMGAPYGQIPKKDLGGATVLGFASTIEFFDNDKLSAH